MTGCDFSPLCVSNVSSNIDEEKVCQFVTMMNDMMVTLLHLSLTSNNIGLNSPVNVMVTMIHL